MALPLVATKLYVPALRRGLVARPRLLRRLDAARDARLVLISAPAGFGKTTLVATWLSSTAGEGAVAWLSLDATDTDPTTFWTGVVAALQRARPGLAHGAQVLLDASPASTELVLTAVVNDLAETPGEVWLVLDDYHLADSLAVAAGVGFLLDHLSPNAHLVMITRADPDLPLARWRAGGELVEVRAVDLRFTSEETAAYLGDATTRTLTAEQMRALEDRTEGWIAALQLAAISLESHDDVAGFVAGFAGDDRHVVDYLVEEVLSRQAPAVRDFLLRSAVLDRLSGPLCDAVVAGVADDLAATAGPPAPADGDRMLQSLERDNLFVVALDDRREWYRYHQLFADVLRSRLLAAQPGLVPVLHRRASRWFEAHELADPAIRHALAAGDVDRAAALVELAVPAVRRHRQEAVAQTWLSALPAHTIRRSAMLSVLSAGLLLVAGDLVAVSARLDDAERALAEPPHPQPLLAEPSLTQHALGSTPSDNEELRTLPSTIAIYRASLAQARGDVAGTARHARRALDLAEPDDHVARGGAAGFLGLAAWAEGDVSTALVTFGQAVQSLHAAGNVVDELSGTVVLADLWRAAGRPSRAREICDRALALAESRGVTVARATAELHVALSELDVEVGDLESARRHLEVGADLGRRTAATESLFRSFVAKALLARADGDTAAALEHLDRAEQLYRPGFFPDVRPIPALRARLRIAAGDLSTAAEWARDRALSVEDPVTHLCEYDHLSLVRLRLAEHHVRPRPGALDGLLSLLDRLREAAEGAARCGSLVEIGVLTALVLDAQGLRPRALTALTEVWVQAPEPDSALRVFLDEGTPMLELLRAAEHDRVVGHHARRLLAAATAPLPAKDTTSRLPGHPPVEQLSVREEQVLRLLAGDLSGPDIARELFISPNTLRTHTKHIFTKLGVTSRRAAVHRARER